MKLTVTIHLWAAKLRRLVRRWLDLGFDLTDLVIDQEEIERALGAGAGVLSRRDLALILRKKKVQEPVLSTGLIRS